MTISDFEARCYIGRKASDNPVSNKLTMFRMIVAEGLVPEELDMLTSRQYEEICYSSDAEVAIILQDVPRDTLRGMTREYGNLIASALVLNNEALLSRFGIYNKF